MYNKVLIIVMSTLLKQNQTVLSVIIVIVLSIYLTLCLVIKPFMNKRINQLSITSVFTLILTIYFGTQIKLIV